MRDGERAESDVVLLGGGHAHLAALRRFADRRPPGLRLTVISRSAHTLYSGMVAGVLRGDYAPEAAFVALAPLAAAAGARLVVAEALGIDPEGRVHLHRERAVRFDILSIDIGGETAPPPGGFGVKPISGLFAHLAQADATLGADGRWSATDPNRSPTRRRWHAAPHGARWWTPAWSWSAVSPPRRSAPACWSCPTARRCRPARSSGRQPRAARRCCAIPASPVTPTAACWLT